MSVREDAEEANEGEQASERATVGRYGQKPSLYATSLVKRTDPDVDAKSEMQGRHVLLTREAAQERVLRTTDMDAVAPALAFLHARALPHAR
eukprot:6210105-Pleurochrysis_carterae.AAC.2